MTSVLIVDDHSIFRSGLRADLDGALEVLGEAATVDEAVALIASMHPEVVLLDVHLPGGAGGGGAEVIRRSAGLLEGTRFLALSVSDSAEDVVGVIRAGARGYITKGSSGAEVSAAVLAVAGGDAVFSPRLAGFVLDAFGAVAGEQAETSEELDRLSAREREVLRMVAGGYTSVEIGARLTISSMTVNTHIKNIYRKLQVRTRAQAVRFASLRGMF